MSWLQKMAPKPRHSAVQEELLFCFRAADAQRIAQAYPEFRIAAERDPGFGPRHRRVPLGSAADRDQRGD